jgi:hypothetical protein
MACVQASLFKLRTGPRHTRTADRKNCPFGEAAWHAPLVNHVALFAMGIEHHARRRYFSVFEIIILYLMVIFMIFLEFGCSPIERTYGRAAQLGLPQSKLLNAIYDKANSEEQILEYLQDSEL